MNVAKDKIDKRRNPAQHGVVDDYGFPDQPMLDEMAAKALEVLAQNKNGFVAMIEGGSIEVAHRPPSSAGNGSPRSASTLA